MPVKIARAALLLSVSLEVAGCVSTDIANGPPTVTFDTPAKAEDIRDCINAKDPGAFSTLPFQGGWLVAYRTGFNREGLEVWEVRLAPAGTQTHVEGRYVGGQEGKKSVDFDNDVKPCLDNLPR